MTQQQNSAADDVKPVGVPASVKVATQSSPEWGLPSHHLDRWPAFLAMVATIALYVILPERVVIAGQIMGLTWPRNLVPILESLVLIPILLTNVSDRMRHVRWKRPTFMVLMAMVTVTNYVATGLLIHNLTAGHAPQARELVLAAVEIWVTNVLIFALWYWELDRGGPSERVTREHEEPDFLFAQMTEPGSAPRGWSPNFMDYLYVAFTNATAFSPTDTMPLTIWAKILMMIQASGSLVTVVIVGARAVNILNS